MIAIILQVTGAILLAKGLLFRKERDLVLRVFPLAKDINKKVTKMMEYHYSETYVSLIGATLLSFGYFLPLIGFEIGYESLAWYTRLIFGLLGIIILVTLAIVISDVAGKIKAEKTDEELLMKKYEKELRNMGYFIFGVENDEEKHS